MYDDLTQEEAISLAMDHIAAGVGVPDALIDRLDDDLINAIASEQCDQSTQLTKYSTD